MRREKETDNNPKTQKKNQPGHKLRTGNTRSRRKGNTSNNATNREKRTQYKNNHYQGKQKIIRQKSRTQKITSSPLKQNNIKEHCAVGNKIPPGGIPLLRKRIPNTNEKASKAAEATATSKYAEKTKKERPCQMTPPGTQHLKTEPSLEFQEFMQNRQSRKSQTAVKRRGGDNNQSQGKKSYKTSSPKQGHEDTRTKETEKEQS